jgi:hypothetical protein
MPDVPRTLSIPNGYTLDTILSTYPDEPLPNIAGFDRLRTDGNVEQVRQLNAWIEPQATCDIVIKHHGTSGLLAVISGIARASAAFKVPMSGRVAAMAGALGIAPV